METAVYGKNAPKKGRAPAVALVNPWFTGDRISMALDSKKRLPREERMKGYREVELRQHDEFFDQFEPDIVPVAVELRPNAESLPLFVHPERALYIFGPEDGTLGGAYLRRCHRFVVIPTRHCVNLAAAIYLVLYDRSVKLNPSATIYDTLAEQRFWTDNDDLDKQLGLSMS